MSTVLELGSPVWNKTGSLRGTVVGIQNTFGWKTYKVRWDNDTVGWYARSVLDA